MVSAKHTFVNTERQNEGDLDRVSESWLTHFGPSYLVQLGGLTAVARNLSYLMHTIIEFMLNSSVQWCGP